MKFQKKKQRISVDWKEGAVLYFERPLWTDLVIEWPELAKDSSLPIEQAELYGIHLIKAALVGWDNIDDSDTGKALKFNNVNRVEILNAILDDKEMVEKIKIAMRGATGNLDSGLTASSTTDGIQDHAPNVSEKEKTS